MVSSIFLVFMASFVSVLNSERIEYDTEFEPSRSSPLISSSSFVESESFSDQNFENGEFFYSSYEGNGEGLSSFSSFVSDSNTHEGGCGLTRPPNIIICGPDEEFNSCVNGGCGRWNCSQPGIMCIDLIKGACVPGCRCRKPLLRRDDGKCVPSDKCPPQCGLNEEYVKCKDTVCRPKSCTDLRFPLPCWQSISDGTEKTACEQGPGCVCKEGYVRNDTGSCIPDYQCPPNITCGPDEVFDGCVNGGCGRWNCSQPGVICIDLIEGACKPGCRCKEPLLRTDDGKCVPSNQCPSPCGVNEEYVDNPVCRPQTCSDLGFPLPCQKDEASNQGPGCVCMEGYVRDVYGNCISDKECPSCGGDSNATSGCGTFCTTCDNYGQDVACILPCQLNGCACKEGFVYDEKIKKCILPENCPAKTCNKPNQILGCKNHCGTLRCDTRFKMLFKCPPPPKDCEQGCVCKPGYYKTNDGRCVTKEECPVKCPGENTVYACPKGCAPQVCESIGKVFHCPLIKTSQNCTKECRCKDGFYKNKIGECISEKQCLQCNGPNEYFSCGKECDNVCATLNVQNQTNCPYDNIVCNPMCYCEEGYARDANNTCIPIENCPVQCGINEEYVDNPVCRPETCSDLGFPLPCMEEGAETSCKQGPGCVCMEGYVRDANGICISDKDCPSCGGDPNATTGCGTFCTTCDNYGQHDVPCILLCKLNGCACKEGFVYDGKSRKCVLPENCPAKTCNKPNEIQGCKNACPPRTCEAKDRVYKCPPRPQVCYPDCVCKPGFFRNKNGDCVTKEQCSPNITCGPDEVFDGCVNGGCGRWNCSQPGVICIDLIEGACKPGCRCKKPLLRTDDGKCVPSNQCPSPCGVNEEYVDNPVCRPQTCSDLGFPLPCQKDEASNQGPGCVCMEGYVRDVYGNCISDKECPSCGGDSNATSGCGTFCTTCDNYGQDVACIRSCQFNGCACKEGFVYDEKSKKCILPENCPAKTCNKPNEILGCKNQCGSLRCDSRFDILFKCPPPPKDCEQGCVCKPGYYKTNDGRCVTKEECPVKCPGENTVYECRKNCIPQVCESIGKEFHCRPIKTSQNCTKECRCKDGFYKNKIGECISEKQCLQCNGPNEYFSCGKECDNVCATLNVQNQTNCPYDNIVCNPMCYCEEGYARDANNTCIPIGNCPVQCGINEEYVDNPVCRPETCSDLGFPLPCMEEGAETSCKQGPGCVCMEGYVRDANGSCISAKNCPSCGGDLNATTGCGTFCTTCDNYGQEVACILSCELNGCACKEGFVYDEKSKKCVLPENCPAKTCNKPNEIQGCKNACPPRTCEAKDRVYKCLPRPQVCYPDCVCKPGFFRNKNGDCVTKEQCSAPKCTGKNEVLERAVSCPPQTCESILALYNCPKKNASLSTTFECRCKPGYYRNKLNECISREECDQCRGPNEFFSCGGACDNVCATLKIQNQTNCPIINIKCNPMCYCEKGYARDANNICIPIEKCPVQCGVNEEYVNSPVCRPETCTDLGFPLPCMEEGAKTSCKQGPGCVCMEGYVRNAKGKCVSAKECPSCGGDPNATTGCGTFCTTCDNYGQEVACILSCQLNGCACKEGFVYDEKSKRCVLPENCPKKCNKPNEVLGCKNPCPLLTCDTRLQRLYKCPPRPKICEPDCVCKPGFYRNKDGGCVTEAECSVPKCTGKNEVYELAVPCPPQTCESIYAKYNCSATSVTSSNKYECRCKSGYLRNKNNECITIEECQKCKGPNEFFSCGGACDNVCATLKIQNQTKCPIINVKCNPMCYCDKGYARDANNTCIPIEDCPVQCGINEEYVDNPVCRPETCSDLGFPLPCMEEGAETSCKQGPGCVCMEGYVRDANGSCISAKNCPSCGGDPNATTGCGTFCTTCDNYGQDVACILLCKFNGCACKEGFVYDEKNKKCVLPENCPAKTCNKPNEIQGCKNACPPRTCEAKDRVSKCPPRPQVCYPDCVCKPGFYRNKNGDCVTKEQCYQCKGPNEFFSCGGACDNVCATLKIQNQTNCPIINVKCNPMCYCEKGYARDANNICIPIEKCPAQCGVNEEYVNSPVCRPETCTDLGFPLPCMEEGAKTSCKQGPGCVCMEGYVRDAKGNCVSAKECPSCGGDPNATTGCGTFCTTCDNYGQDVACILSCQLNGCACKKGFVYDEKSKRCVLPENCPAPKCTGQNEVYELAVPCPPQTCESIYAKYNCSATNATSSNKYECRCKSGYLRNKNNECITIEECQKCKGPNEFFSCGGACDNVCATLKIQNQTKCPIINVKCNPMCYCDKGYARDANNTCIPIEDCPGQCKNNEEFVECPDALCRPTKCKDVGFPIACPSFSQCPSKPGCVCSAGYVKHGNGTCIPAKDCPSCGGDKNAVVGCGINCNRRCFGNTKICPRICKFNSCDCKPGFLFDANINKCVLPGQCTAACGPNETYSTCTNRACHRNNCAQLSIPWVCRSIAIHSSKPGPNCRAGCECISGYLRNNNNTCIPQEQCPEATNNTPSPSTCNADDNEEGQLVDGNSIFTSKFLYDAAKNNPGKSVVASPFSVLFLLAQLALFTTGVAAEQLYALLNLKNPQQIRGTIPPFLSSFNSEKNITLALAEKVFGSENYPFSERFKDVTKNLFMSEAQNLDFSKPAEAAKIINDWVASKTNNLIQNLVPAQSLDANTRLVLANAIYFKGNWSKIFKKSNTKTKDFCVSDSKTVKVQMMNQVNSFRYGVTPESNSQVIELPYINENCTFLVLLPPKTADGLSNLLKEQLNFSFIKSVIGKLKSTKVNLSLPAFKTETSTDLQDILMKSNVTQIFNPQGSGLSGILAKPQKLYVSSALQKASIIVTETGAEAAAANAITIGATAVLAPPQPPIIFNADHSFVYYILYRGIPIFCGLYAGPQ